MTIWRQSEGRPCKFGQRDKIDCYLYQAWDLICFPFLLLSRGSLRMVQPLWYIIRSMLEGPGRPPSWSVDDGHNSGHGQKLEPA